MNNVEVSRRFVVSALGAGAAAVATQVTTGQSLACEGQQQVQRQVVEPAVAPTAEQAVAVSLLAPLQPGSVLGEWQVVAIEPVTEGAVSVLLRDAEGVAFQVDICARDQAEGAARGPGVTERFELFLANTGDGATATVEHHGLAAMALAELVRTNENHVDTSGFRVLRDRVQAARRHVG